MVYNHPSNFTGHSTGPIGLVGVTVRAGQIPSVLPQKGEGRRDQVPNVTLHELCALSNPFSSLRLHYIFPSRQEEVKPGFWGHSHFGSQLTSCHWVWTWVMHEWAVTREGKLNLWSDVSSYFHMQIFHTWCLHGLIVERSSSWLISFSPKCLA